MSADLTMYETHTVVVRPGHPGRWAFAQVTPSGRVMLRKVSPAGRRHGTVYVDGGVYERDYVVARTPEQREVDQAALLRAIHTKSPLPDRPYQDADLRILCKAGLIKRTPDGDYVTTYKHDVAFDRVTEED